MKSPAYTFLAAVFAAAPLAHAQRDLTDIPNPDPEVERASFQLPEGLEANLFAGDPLIRKPIQIAWDQRGRLWVASSETYPQIKPGQPLEDKVIVLEDADGDGKAEKSTVFAENLLIPTGIFPVGPGEAAVLGFGAEDKGFGCYVANSTELIYLRDTDGDGRADTRHVMLSGFGTEDTHHIIHTFRGAPDGGFFFSQSIYIHSHVETPWGVRRLGGGGAWHYRPETGQMEVFYRGQVNPWGHVLDKWGQSFTADGAYGEGVNHAFPGAAFFWAKEDDWTKDFPRILKGLNPGQPKQCAIEIISGRHFPEEWRGRMVLPDFRGNRVNTFVVTDNGSGYQSRQVDDLIKTTHRAFRPIDLKMGPDGAIYIADWYNPIIQHGEVDFRDERRDHTRGRVWRISAKGRPPVERPKLVGETTENVLAQLKAPEDWTRFFAKRELRERRAQKGTAAAFAKWVQTLDKTAPDWAQTATEALWASEHLGLPFPQLALDLARHEDFNARAVAQRWIWRSLMNRSVQAAPGTPDKAGVADKHPRVRLEAIHCLRAIHSAKATELALTALDLPMDENLDFALWLTCRETQDAWLPAFQRGEITFGGNFKHAVFALKAAGNPAALQPLVAALRDGKIAEADRPQVLQLISQMGGAAELALLMENGTAPMLDLVAQTVRTRGVRPDHAEKALAFLDHADAAVRRSAARLCGMLKLEPAREKLVIWLGSPGADAADVQAAFDALISLGGDGTRRIIASVADKSDAPLGQRAQAVAALASVDLNDAAKRAAALFESEATSAVAPALFDAFVTRKDGPAALAAVLAGKKLPESIAQVGLQKASASGGETQGLKDALAAASPMKPINQKLSPEEMNALVAEVKAKGDPHRGESVYRRQALLCMTCHGISGGGPEIGPNLVSIGASAQVDYLIESLLDPSAKIKEGYHTSVITTKEGSVLAGAIAKQDDQTVTLRDAAGVLQVVAKANIAKNEIQPISLMPPGLTASLPRNEFLDLVSFLSQLGREGDFKVGPQNLVRRWRVLTYNDAIGRAHNLGGDRLFASTDPSLPFVPAYSATDGSLPLDSVPAVKLWSGMERRVAQFDVDVTTAGTFTLAFAEPAGLKLVVGEKVLDAQPRTTISLPQGRQTLAVYAEAAQRKAPLRVEFADDAAATGRGQIVTGR